MKKLIKSITSVITNSSSEVFLMDSGLAHEIANDYVTDCIRIQEITEEYLENDARYESNAIFEVCELDKHLTDEDKELVESSGIYFITQEDWSKIYHKYKDIIDGKMMGKAFIDIEDHFTNCDDAYDDAKGHAIWSDYRH